MTWTHRNVNTINSRKSTFESFRQPSITTTTIQCKIQHCQILPHPLLPQLIARANMEICLTHKALTMSQPSLDERDMLLLTTTIFVVIRKQPTTIMEA